MRVLKLLLMVTVYFIPVQTNISAEKMAVKYCTNAGYEEYSYIQDQDPVGNQNLYIYPGSTSISSQKRVANTAFSDCISGFLSYIAKRGMPSEEEINEFQKFCVDHEIGSKQSCTVLIYLLGDYGYTFHTAKELLQDILTKQPDLNLARNWQNIHLDYSLRKELLRVDNLDIDRCIYYFLKDKNGKEAMMTSYLTWWKTEHEKEVYCDCDLVLGLCGIHDGRKETDVSVLSDYYENICSVKYFPGKDKWNMYNLICIGEGKNPLNGKNLKNVLSTFVPLLEVGWCANGSTLVPFDYLWTKVKSASSDEMQYITYAVSANFNGDHYQKLLKILAPYGDDFAGKKCLDDIIEAAFKRDVFTYKGETRIKISYVWNLSESKRNNPSDVAEHPFNTHIQILLEIFKKTKSTTVTCKNFVTYLAKFKSILVQRNFSKDSVTTNLSEFNNKGMDLDDVIQCYQFTLDVENQMVYTYKMLRRVKDDWAYANESLYYKIGMSEFRRLLFQRQTNKLKQICANEDPRLNTYSKNGIWNLVNLVFNNTEYNDMSDLFSDVSRKIKEEIP